MSTGVANVWRGMSIRYQTALSDIRQVHRSRKGFRHELCAVCNEPWPCTTVAIVEEALS